MRSEWDGVTWFKFGGRAVKIELFFTLADSDVDADHAVLIAYPDHGHITRDVVFHLDDLL
ncbi:MAG: hypothetical protein DMG86_13210 [Acidobacteria bacterium]|nr:MAG: hypothetical protein DMG86_13210 [Acidobacteriota bacterium]